MIDFHHILPRHDEINIRLEQWGRWVRPQTRAWGMQPMFRMYQSKARQWEMPEIKAPISTIDALEIERAVAYMPEPHRTILRWFYVYPWIVPGIVIRKTGMSGGKLSDALHDARDMVKNRLKEKLVDNG